MLGRDDHGLCFAVSQRRHCAGVDRQRKIGSALGPRRMHHAVNLDCAIAVEPARKRFSDVLGPHEFLLRFSIVSRALRHGERS